MLEISIKSFSKRIILHTFSAKFVHVITVIPTHDKMPAIIVKYELSEKVKLKRSHLFSRRKRALK